MNTAVSNNTLEEFNILTRATSPSLKPIPRTSDLHEDLQLFRVLDSTDYLPSHTHLPEKRHSVLDVDSMVVSGSLMRRIEHELKHDDCDARTVFYSCRGLTRGTREFEDAYIAARIRSSAKHQRISNESFLGKQACLNTEPLTSYQAAMGQNMSPHLHPMAVIHLGHLMSHLGIWVMLLLGTQAYAVWRLSAFANVYLEGGRFFYLTIGLFLMLALDSAVWFRRRGVLCNVFLIPGAVLFLMASMPILALHLREVLLAMR